MRGLMHSSRRQTILVVDDTVSNIEVLNSILGTDYDILFATSGKEALTVAGQQAPDLVLLDVVMPEIDGYSICAYLKADERTRDIPVIFVTAKDQEEEESRGLNAGAVDYITKPVRSSIVRARVRNHLELKQYRDYLKTLSTVDGLTGISNRRHFDEIIDMEWRRARRSLSPLSLLMIDIDFFKPFNDNYGHLSGDDCLRYLAKGLTSVVGRPADLLARYGGEEFALLLPETGSSGAVRMADRIQEKVKFIKIPHAYSPVSDHVTLSIGAATMVPVDGSTQSDLINSADGLLYEAKKGGRNQIKAREILL